MKSIVAFAIAFFVTILMLSSKAYGQEAKPADGKAVFLSFKCESCHAIKSMAIEAKKAEGEDAGDNKGSDLSGVGLKRDADFIVKYLQKLEAIEGKKHMKKFKGTEDELKMLASWLAELKTKE